MNYNEFSYIYNFSNIKIYKVIDGDSILVKDLATNNKFEVRLNGIDAPELKKCPKLLQDERETHLAGQLLMQLGRLSLKYLLELVPIDTKCKLAVEHKNPLDKYGRTLAYIYLPDGRCINEMLISEGYAKPYNRYFCNELLKYQVLNNIAKRTEKGLYSVVPFF